MINEKFTEERIEKIVELFRNGGRISNVARSVLITPQCLHNWLNDGKNNKTPEKAKFYEDVMKAQADLQQSLIERWVNISENSGDFRSVQNLLERLNPNDWSGPVQKIQTVGQINHKHEVTITNEVERLSTVELEQLLLLMDKMNDVKQIGDGSDDEVIDVDVVEEG